MAPHILIRAAGWRYVIRSRSGSIREKAPQVSRCRLSDIHDLDIAQKAIDSVVSGN
jgi:hypothetical protein